MSHSPRYLAGGGIAPSRFVKIDTTSGANFTVIEASAATDKIVGVSQEGTRLAQIEGLTTDEDAARSGENLRVYGPGEECLIKAGGTITQGDWLTATTDGKAVAITASGTVVHAGFALESGVSGDLIRMFVHPFVCKYS
jgi:hypothetical protein